VKTFCGHSYAFTVWNMIVYFRLIMIGESVFLLAEVVLFGIVCYCTNSWDRQIIII
jgi:hypothetical protein